MEQTPVEATQKYFEGVEWPVSKEELLSAAEANGAPDDVLQALRAEDKEHYSGPNDVHNTLWKEA